MIEPAPAKPMRRGDIIHRRYEAMRMRWPNEDWAFITQEALALAARKLIRPQFRPSR